MTLFFGTEVPSLGGNLTAAIIFGLCLVFHIAVGIKYRQWWFMGTWAIGLLAEFIGYAARIAGHYNPSSMGAFSAQMALLTFAPALFMAGIYFQLGIFTRVYGRQYTLLGPRMTTRLFIGIDIFSILIQCSGGGLASTATSGKGSATMGTNIMVGGLVVQVLGTTGFLVALLYFYVKGYKAGLHQRLVISSDRPYDPSESSEEVVLRQWGTKFQRNGYNYRTEGTVPSKENSFVLGVWFPVAILASTLLIYVRSIYRVVELSEGWNGTLMYHEVYLMTLEMMLVASAVLCLTIYHPAFKFGRGDAIKRFAPVA